MYEYLIGDLLIVIIWFILYFVRKDLRKEMIFSSFLCLPLAISDFIFIPNYWNPHTLFNFRPGIESFIFTFTVGGIAAVLYEVVFKKHLKKTREKQSSFKKSFYMLFGIVTFFVFLFMLIFRMELIYAGIIAMATGAITIMISRKDLIKEVIFGGILFSLLYFIFLFIFNTFIFPNWIADTWNFGNILGITVLKIPIEEILWALTFGAIWAPIYEDLKGYTLR